MKKKIWKVIELNIWCFLPTAWIMGFCEVVLAKNRVHGWSYYAIDGALVLVFLFLSRIMRMHGFKLLQIIINNLVVLGTFALSVWLYFNVIP